MKTETRDDSIHWEVQRFDPIRYNENGGGWSFDPSAIKECDDGEYVRFSEFQECLKITESALNELQSIRERYGIGDRHVMREKDREIRNLRKALREAELHMKHGLNCHMRIGNYPCTCGMFSAWEQAQKILKNDQDEDRKNQKTP